jgi:hypothetical protein
LGEAPFPSLILVQDPWVFGGDHILTSIIMAMGCLLLGDLAKV